MESQQVLNPLLTSQEQGNESTNKNQISNTSEIVENVIDVKETKECCSGKCNCFLDILYQYIPITKWIQTYNLEKFRYDLIAGITVGIMVIPQGMAYAMLANLPPIYGLYSCLFPVITYGILGTSMQAHIGPFALISMLVGSTVSAIVSPSESTMNEYINCVLLLSLLIGVFLTVLGFARLGAITALLSETVITAFTASSAFNIGGSQLKHYVGASVKSDDFLHICIELFSWENIQKYNYCQLILGITATILLYAMKELNKRYLKKVPLPNELFLVIIYTLISWGFDLKGKYDIKILGDQPIPSGLPDFFIPSFNHVYQLIPGVIIVGLVDFIVTYSMGKIFARKHNYHVDENQELIALGVSNIVGSMSSSYPAAGSLSRTALIDNLQAQTSFHNFISPLIIILTLFTLTDVVKYLPNSTLAAVVEINLINLFKQLGDIVKCYTVDLCDFFTFLFCCILNICFGTEIGLLGGVSVSFLTFLIQMIYSYIKYPVKLDQKDDFSILEQNNNYLIYHVKYTFMFVNREYHIKHIEKILKLNDSNKTMILDFSSVKYIDMSGFMSLEELLNKHTNIILYIKNEQTIAHMQAYNTSKKQFQYIQSLNELSI